MKMPGQLDFGVQSLGRPDKGAMRDQANAEQQAALAWGQALSTAGTELATVATAESMADANLTLSERVAMDKKSTAELDAWLTNNQAFDLNAVPLPDAESGASAPQIPAAVRKAAERLGLSGRVNTYEIAIEASRQHFEQSRKASSEAMSEHMASDKALTSYNKQMDGSWALSAKSATKTHILQRIQHLSARADLLYTGALNNLDEGAMMAIAIEAEQTGIWTPAYAGDKVAAIGSTVDQVEATRMYRDVTRQADVDEADEFVDTSRIDPAGRMAMFRLSDQQQEFLYNQEQRKQPVNYAKAQAKLIEGTLTKSEVADMARNGKISGAHANTLRTALAQPTPIVSDPQIVSDLRGNIALLRFSDGDFSSTTDRARVMRDLLRMQFTGTDNTGNRVDKSLTGTDFEELMGLVDEYENTALGQGGQRYATAVRTIKALTGYSDALSAEIEGPYPAGQAYAAFTMALQDHMDAMGTEANPSEFVARNVQHFTADVYVKSLHKRLSFQYPQFSGLFEKLLVNQKVPDLNTGEVYVTIGTVLNEARNHVERNILSEAEYHDLRRSLNYLNYTDDDYGPASISGMN